MKRALFRDGIVWVMGVLALLAWAGPALGELKLSYQETSLGKVIAGGRGDLMVFSADGKHAAYPAQVKPKWVVVRDGKAGAEHDWLLPKTLVFSPDGARLSYFIQKGDRTCVVVDEEVGKDYAEVLSPWARFSEDGRRMAYVARADAPAAAAVRKKSEQRPVFVVLDGGEGKRYETIHARTLVFTKDGKRLAYAAGADGELFWVIDGKEQKAYDHVGVIAFSADGARHAYVAERDGKQLVVIDGRETKAYDKAGFVTFSADGKRVAYAAAVGRQYYCVVDGTESKAYDLVSEPVFSSDGQRVAFIAVESRLFCVVNNGVEGQLYDRVADLVFSGDGKHLAYRAVEQRRMRIVVDEKAGKDYAIVSPPHLSADGSKLAHAVKEGESEFLVINDQRHPGPNHITISPDGKYVAHSLDQSIKGTLWINGTEGKTWDGFVRGARWMWTGPQTLTLFAAKDQEMIRVEVTVSGE